MLNLIMLILWFIAGMIVMTSKKQITKLDYGLVWVVMLIQMIENFIK